MRPIHWVQLYNNPCLVQVVMCCEICLLESAVQQCALCGCQRYELMLRHCPLQVRHLLHSHDMVTNLAANGLKPEDVMGSLLGPWGASSPQTDLKRHEMEKLLKTASADSSETRSAKQELEKLLNLAPATDDVKPELDQAPTDKKAEGPDT